MDAKVVNHIVDVIAIFGAVAIIYLVNRARKKAIENPTGKVLQLGEQKLGEIYCTTRDITFKGFMVAGSALEGKLMLTNNRLIYSTYDEKKTGLSLSAEDVSNIKIGEKGLLDKTTTVTLAYVDKRKNKSKSVTFKFPEKASNQSFGKEYKNPQSIETFLKLLLSWKGQTPVDKVFECSGCGTLVAESTKVCPRCKNEFE